VVAEAVVMTPEAAKRAARRDAVKDMLRSGVRLHDVRRVTGASMAAMGRITGAPTSRGRKTDRVVQL
jgi:uncharacterized protein YerC